MDETLLTLDEMARALSRSVPTIRDMIKGGAPVAVQGGNGRPYGLLLSAWREWIDARERIAQEEHAKRQAAITQSQLNLEGGDTRGDHLVSADIRKEFYSAELLHNKVARERGELVQVAQLRQVDDLRMRAIATFLQGLPDQIAKRCDLESGVVAELVAAVDEFQERLARFLMNTDFTGRTPEDVAAMLTRLESYDAAIDPGGS